MMRLKHLIVVIAGGAALRAPASPSYPIVDTGQAACYDNRGKIAPPKPGEPFYGQDAQQRGNPPSYALGAGGLTVSDNVTGLTWQRSPDTNGNGEPDSGDKLTLRQAEALPAKLNSARFGGFNDWRLPTIKELYSLILFSGVDAGPGADASRMNPFIDTKYFKFAYGDERAGERAIDSQWATCSRYAANSNQMFGVNFADGRIKGYGLSMPGRGEKTFFVICCRGNPRYGRNEFRDNGDGTISDRATGLMWAKADSGKGLDWEAALAWVKERNAERLLGHDDWRLPNAKELQSIVDYTRSPDTSNSPAIDPLFVSTRITNEAGKADYPCYWTGTTHASVLSGGNAVYLAFGRAAGWPTGIPGQGGPGRGGPPPPRRESSRSAAAPFVDVHGAGAQRSDPKTGDPAAFPRGRGPQGDVIRIHNFVRCVRTEAAR